MDFRLESSLRDLEQTIHALVVALASERGVEVSETRLELAAASERVLDFKLTCKVRAMIVAATLHVTGRVEIGDDLCARFVNLAVDGDGMIAGVAKAALEPRLAALRGRAFPIADLKMPGLVVRNVGVSVGDAIRLTVTLEGRA